MASMNISIRKEAYEFLKSRKTKGRSFSDVILGFKEEQDIMTYFGALPNIVYDDSFKKNFDRKMI